MQIPFYNQKKYWAAAAIVLFAVYWIIMIWLYRYLPDEIPMHFNLSGEATRFSDTDITTWFLVPIVASFTGIHTLLIGWAFFTAGIENLNFPEKKQVLRLSSEQQKPFRKMLKGYFIKTLLVTFCYSVIIFMMIGIYTWGYVTGQLQFSFSFLILVLSLFYVGIVTRDYFSLKRLFKNKLGQIV